jgi:hypothetical protein
MYGGRAPAFASDEFQLPYLDLEEYHLTEQALRRLVRQVRKQLKQTDTYYGSKLQQLDSFEVKLSQLSTSKIVIRPGIMSQRRRKGRLGITETQQRSLRPRRREGDQRALLNNTFFHCMDNRDAYWRAQGQCE